MHYATEDTFLQMIRTSARDGTSLFTSWEPDRHGQFSFLTMTALADRAAEWLYLTMNTLLNIYELQKCAKVYGPSVAEMPREETNLRPDSFILD